MDSVREENAERVCVERVCAWRESVRGESVCRVCAWGECAWCVCVCAWRESAWRESAWKECVCVERVCAVRVDCAASDSSVCGRVCVCLYVCHAHKTHSHAAAREAREGEREGEWKAVCRQGADNTLEAP